MRVPSLDLRGRWFEWRLRRSWMDQIGALVTAIALALLIAELVVNPTRRLITFAVGLAFVAGVYAVSSVTSLAVLVFLLPFGVSISIGNTNMIFILFLALLVLMRRYRAEGAIFTSTSLSLPMFFLLGIHLVSFYNVPEGERVLAVQKIFGLATAMVVFSLVVTIVRDVETLRKILLASVLGCAATCVVASYELAHPGHSILPYFFYAPWSARQGTVRVVGTFRNYSNYAQYLAMNMLIIAFLLLRARQGLARGFFFVLLCGVCAIFLTSGMRGAFLAILVTGGYVAIYGRRALKLREVGAGAAVFVMVLAMAGLFMSQVVRQGTLFTRFANLGLTGGSQESRLEIMKHLLSKVPEHVLVGHGPVIRVPTAMTVALSSNNPHNQYLYYLYTVGVLGLVAFLWFAVKLGLEGHWTLVRTRDADPFALGLLAVFQGNLVLFLFHELADDYMFSAISMHVTWFFFGMLVATMRLVRETVPSGLRAERAT